MTRTRRAIGVRGRTKLAHAGVALAIVCGVTAIGVGLAPSPAGATHFRSAGFSWEVTGETSTVWHTSIHMSQSWRWSFNWPSGAYPSVGTPIDTGNLQVTGGSFSQTLTTRQTVISIDAPNDLMVTEGDLTVDLPKASAPFTAFLGSCCRTSPPNNINSPDSNILLTSYLDPRVAEATPEAEIPPIVDCAANAVCSFPIPSHNHDDLPMRYRLATTAESGITNQPGPPKAPNAATIDPTTGVFSWDTTGATYSTVGDTDYATQVVVEALSGSTVVASTPLDFVIRVAQPTAPAAPVFSAGTPASGTVFPVDFGSPVSFTFGASSAPPGRVVTLGAFGKPATATLMTAAANPATATFTWTATTPGDVNVSLTATDDLGYGAPPRSVVIHVVGDGRCLPGAYSADGKLPCTPAPAGSYSPGPGATTVIRCPAATYSTGGAATCSIPQPGYYVPRNPFQGATSATPCDPGKYQPDAGAEFCEDAEPGYSVPTSAAIAMTPCPAGTYGPVVRLATCLNAPAGSFAAGTTNVSSTKCAIGTFTDAPGASECIPAPKGSFVPTTGATQATLCLPGTFSDVTRATSCTNAPPGSYAAGSGSTTAAVCPAGSFSATAGAASCTPAPIGSYVPDAGSTQATPCPPASTSTTEGATSCSLLPVDTTVTLASNLNPSTPGRTVAISAVVAIVGVPAKTTTGTLDFYDGTTLLGTKAVSGGKASLATAVLATGPHTITAVFTRTVGSLPVTSSPLSQTVVPATTALTLSSTASPAPFSRPIALKASVKRVAPGAGTVRGGTVEFFDGEVSLGAVPLGSGSASLPAIPALALGDHSITAVYSGTGDDLGSSSAEPFVQAVSPAATLVMVSTNVAGPKAGQSVTIKATVKALAPAKGAITTGVVHFFDNGVPYLDVPIVNGTATLPATRALAVGLHVIDANYDGSDERFPAGGTAQVTVVPADTAVTFTSSALTAIHGRNVTFTATVKTVAPGSGTPTGTVTFLDGDTVLATVPVSIAGKATLVLNTLAIGPHTLTATYSGSEARNVSTSPPVAQTIT